MEEMEDNVDVQVYMSKEDIEDRLNEVKGKIPSFLIEDLKRNLSGRRVTDNQVDRIVCKITDMYRMRQEKLDSSIEAVKDIAEIKEELSALKKEIHALKGGVDDILLDLRILAVPDINIESIINEALTEESEESEGGHSGEDEGEVGEVEEVGEVGDTDDTATAAEQPPGIEEEAIVGTPSS